MNATWITTTLCLLSLSLQADAAAALRADVVIYGGTPGGLAAAAAVVREGATVIVVEPTSHIGGMVTGGIAITDTGTPELVGGLAADYFNEVASHEVTGLPRAPVLLSRGKEYPWRAPGKWDIEPKVAREVFAKWVKKGRYQLLLAKRVERVRKKGARIAGIRLTDGVEIDGDMFIDASYEGDLMARAGVSNTYGRESSTQYGEKLAGVREPHFVKNYTEEEYATPTIAYMHHGQWGADISARDAAGKLLWGIDGSPLGEIGSADQRIQAYCYRLIATQRAELKMPWPKPAQDHPERYELLLRYIHAHPGITFARLVHLGSIPNGKFDLNASGPFSIDYVDGNRGYPAASYAERDRMLQDHEDYEKGFLWFLAHDSRVPKGLRDEANTWGLAKDEFVDSHFWPTQIYLRESRRMIGQYVMSEKDILQQRTKEDSVGVGSFVLDSHWVRRIVNSEGFVRIEGHLDESINLAKNPYEIPYRSLTPRPQECTNLLVPVCVAATHVAICTIRMEPVYMVLGHSAGVAAVMALRSGKAVQEIDVARLTQKLKEQRQVLHKSQQRQLK
jgi:hypothetical protein